MRALWPLRALRTSRPLWARHCAGSAYWPLRACVAFRPLRTWQALAACGPSGARIALWPLRAWDCGVGPSWSRWPLWADFASWPLWACWPWCAAAAAALLLGWISARH